MRQPLPQLAPLGVAQRRGGFVMQDAVEQPVGKLQPLARAELLQFVEEGGLGHEGKVLSGSRFSTTRRWVWPLHR